MLLNIVKHFSREHFKDLKHLDLERALITLL